jgi:hypothetical protein
MDKSTEINKGILLSREEIVYLMNLLGARSLLGVDRKEVIATEGSIQNERLQKLIMDSLKKRGILTLDEKKTPVLDTKIQSILETLYFPERAFVVTRHCSGFGDQIFYLINRENNTIMHSFPQDREHFLLPIPHTEDIVQQLSTWFPMYGLPISSTKFLIDLKTLEQVRTFAETKEVQKALDHFQIENIDPNEKKNFIHAFADRKISGAITWLSFKENKVDNADSVIILNDGQTGWLISQSKSDKPEELMLSVRSTGADFAMAVREMVERLTGAKLPRQHTDPSGKTIRFAINLDELAMALIAINCTDLSQKLYSGLSGDSKGEHYTERMQKAQQSLMDSGLCTISDRGLPILKEDLAQAVFPIAGSDSMIQISFSEGGPALDTAVYIVHGRFFTVYHNYGEHMQLLEYGKYKDLSSYMESNFLDIGTEQEIQKKTFPIAYEVLEKALKKAGEQQEAFKILVSDGLIDTDAKLLAEDFSDTSFRAVLIRRDAPNRKKKSEEKPEEKKAEKRPNTLLLLKSPRRSWIFHFQESEPKGTATVPDHADFVKALRELIS